MKYTTLSLWIGGLIVLASSGIAPAQVALDTGSGWTVNEAIPDGSPVGITSYHTFNAFSSSPITDVSVNLDISGGFNGDLAGYLTLQDANGNVATELLLNQVGTSLADPFGSSGSGFDVTLSDSGTVNGSIHNASGLPTGTWLPDSPNTLDETFGGLTANGTWTLYLADLSEGGGTATLNSWGLDISVVPEPETCGLLAGAGLLVFSLVNQFRRK